MFNRRRKLQQQPVSGIQSLENRQLLAGDVTVALSSYDARDLVIEGDGSSNQILIEEIAADRIRVTGQDGTRINGGTASVTLTVTDDVTVNMRGGNDRVTMRNLNQVNYSHSDVTIDLGTGHDELNVEEVDVARSLTIRGGDGNDSLDVVETSASRITVDGEYGDDAIALDEVTTHGDVTIDGGEDDDRVLVRDSEINDDLVINSGSGSDNIDVLGVDVADNIVVDAGSGDDLMWIGESDADDIFVYGRTGDDDVYLHKNKVVDQLYANLGTGDDYLWWLSNQAGRHRFDGGTGNDTWSSMEFWWSWSNFYNFE